MRINQNIASLNALRNLSVAETQQGKSLEKLSSGFRVNRAADDAAGLVISEGLRSQVGGLKVAMRNAQDGISFVQTAEGTLTEVHAILQRMRDLSVQAANSGVVSGSATTALQAENDQLALEITRITGAANFNGSAIFAAGAKTFQVGANASDTINVTVGAMTATTLGVNALTVGSASLSTLDTAIDSVSTLRGTLGAAQNRFEHTINSLGVAVENLSASESRIRDTDMAAEVSQMTRHQIMVQAGTAMLAQANQSTQSVLSLLRG